MIANCYRYERRAMAKNESLHKASVAKQDEFYTQISDIERELVHYEDHFRGKVIFCNCDDPAYSNFWRYFQLKFYQLGLKKLVSTHYDPHAPSYKMEIVRKEKGAQLGIPDYVKTPLRQNGDFRSEECIEILKEADVVVTNPPFSLFREYLAQLMEYEKKFVIIANINAITYKECFPLIKNDRIWLGYKSGQQSFAVPDFLERNNTYYLNGQKYAKFGNICWFTNLDIPKRHEGLILVKPYSPDLYPKYDNYDAIEVGKLADIPCDYDGVMGVPITFLDKYDPDQFEILGIDRYVEDNPNYGKRFTINGKEIYARVLIRRKV